MNKKWLVSMLALGLSAVMLAGCAKQDPNAPEGYQTASNDKVDYTLFVPNEWVVDTAQNSLVTSARTSEAERSNITMMVYENTTYTAQTAEDGSEISPVISYWNDNLDDLKKLFDLDSEGNSTFSLETDASNSHFMGKTADGKDVPAYTYVYSGTLNEAPLKYMQVIAYYKDCFYLLTYTAPAERYDTYVGEVEELLTYIVFD